MKLAINSYANDSFGIAEEGQFTFNASAQAFHIVMSGIAKDKVRYPVREVCTNGWDAARGEVTVSLPTWIDPVFKVRDFGPGLSHQQIRDVYTSMFMSTKNGSNDEVGGMGLGCKSPFAYLTAGGQAGSFNVTSYQNGMASHYLMSLGTDGKPKWQLLANVDTTERNGLEVSWAVRASDIDRFQEAAHEILWSFEPRPKVLNQRTKWVENPRVTASGTDWRIYNSVDVPFDRPHIRMGCVYYPVDFSKIDRGYWPWSQQSILFETDIGSLSVTASREELSYDDRTIATMKAKVSLFEDEYLRTLQAEIDAQPNLLAGAKAFFTRPDIRYDRDFRAFLEQRITYKGNKLVSSQRWDRSQLLKCTTRASKVMTFEHDGGRKADASISVFDLMTSDDSFPKIVFERKPQLPSDKFDAAIAAGLLAEGEQVMWLRPKGTTSIEQVSRQLGVPIEEMIDLDQFTVKRRKRAEGEPVYAKLPRWTGSVVYTSSEVDLLEGGFYLARDQKTISDGTGYRRRRGNRTYAVGFNDAEMKLSEIEAWIGKFSGQLKLPDVYLLTDDQLKRAQKHGDWEPYTIQHLLDLMEPLIKFDAVYDGSKEKALNLGYWEERASEEIIKQRDKFPADIIDFADKYEAMKAACGSPDMANTERYNIYKKIGGMKLASTISTVNQDVLDAWNIIRKKYPMFRELLEKVAYDSKRNTQAVATYLTLFHASYQG